MIEGLTPWAILSAIVLWLIRYGHNFWKFDIKQANRRDSKEIQEIREMIVRNNERTLDIMANQTRILEHLISQSLKIEEHSVEYMNWAREMQTAMNQKLDFLSKNK